MTIDDDSGGCHEFTKFVEIFKNCKNVKKLVIESNERNLKENFEDFLPFMTQLEEIKLDCDDYEINERIIAIHESCLGLKKLRVKLAHLQAARIIFNGSDVICESF